ncbi:hypothetical protein [Rhodopirellula europaea]|uniref:hypothetical protein n=1 Tax=Rhodopirellula europaea TaxID=1263866 RepID=UPI0011818715|nr:hypothetical protein [Rhodopirellula europaea]
MYAVIALAALFVSPDYDALIDNLAGDVKTATEAHGTLSNAGIDAFPALLGRIDDKTIINNGLFQGETLHKPTIGIVSFEIIQYQIESGWPKALRRYYALNMQNVSSWLDKHKGRSITQLRIRAVVDSLDAITTEIEEQ